MTRLIIKANAIYLCFILIYVSAAFAYILQRMKKKVIVDNNSITFDEKTIQWSTIENIEVEIYRIPKQEKDFRKLIISCDGMESFELREDRFFDFNSLREYILKQMATRKPELKFLDLV